MQFCCYCYFMTTIAHRRYVSDSVMLLRFYCANLCDDTIKSHNVALNRVFLTFSGCFFFALLHTTEVFIQFSYTLSPAIKCDSPCDFLLCKSFAAFFWTKLEMESAQAHTRIEKLIIHLHGTAEYKRRANVCKKVPCGQLCETME